MDGEPVRIFSREMIEDPFRIYEELRREAGVYHETQMGSYLVLNYDDVMRVLHDTETFSASNNIAIGLRRSDVSPPLISIDPPRHTKLRALLSRAFAPRRIERLEPLLRGIVNDLLDREREQPVEIVSALTEPLPVAAIAYLLGLPPEHHAQFKEWSDVVVALGGAPAGSEGQEAIDAMLSYFTGRIAERRQQPGDDIISLLVQAEIDGERLTDAELRSFCWLLLVAGNETTTNLLSNTLHILADRPELWERMRADASFIPAVVEESLRYMSPVQMLWRLTTREVELGGVQIPEGATVLVGYGPGNRDECAFQQADEFLPGREDDNPHIAFGHGTHYCLGAPLARLEARVALEEMTRRYARIEPGGEPERMQATVLRGFRRLPLMLTAEG